MKLYIGNATKQIFQFYYWVPESSQQAPRHQPIPIGGQVMLAGDFNAMQIDGIIKHHIPYGLINVDQIDRTKVFTGICYSIDKPIPASKLQRLLVINNDALIIKGRETRKLGAIAEHNRLEQIAQQEGLPTPDAYEMTIDEEATKTRDQPSLLSETLSVSRDNDPAAPAAPPKRKRVRMA